jgi:hypothetical protein
MVWFYKASHKSNPSSIHQGYLVVVKGVEGCPEWGYSHAGSLYPESSER